MRIHLFFYASMLLGMCLVLGGCTPTPQPSPTPPPPSATERVNKLSKDLACQLAEKLKRSDTQPVPETQPVRVVITPFTDKSHHAMNLSATLQDRLDSDLFDTNRLTVVLDKDGVDKVLAQLALQGTKPDLFNPDTLVQMHNLTAAQAMVTCTINQLNPESDFNMDIKIKDLSTGEPLCVATGSIGADVVKITSPPPSGPHDPQLGCRCVAPMAIYDDPLLACVLAASTYPNQVKQANAYISSNPGATDDQISGQSWDTSVQQLAHFPAALSQLAADPDWMASLGSAYTNQPGDVMGAIQQMRAQAIVQKNLASNPQQVVSTGEFDCEHPACIARRNFRACLRSRSGLHAALRCHDFLAAIRRRFGLRTFATGRDALFYQGDWRRGPYVYQDGNWAPTTRGGRIQAQIVQHDPRVPPPNFTRATYVLPKAVIGRQREIDASMRSKAPERLTIIPPPPPPPPPPTLKEIKPSAAQMGSREAPITVIGTGFIAGSKVNFDGVTIPTKFGGATTLTATIPASYLTKVRTFKVTVSTPTRGTTVAAKFDVTDGKPVTFTRLDPSSATAGSPATPVTLTGTGFAEGSVVYIGQTQINAKFVSSTSLTAKIPAASLTKEGPLNVVVESGGHRTPGLTFTVGSGGKPVITNVMPGQPSPTLTRQLRCREQIRQQFGCRVQWVAARDTLCRRNSVECDNSHRRFENSRCLSDLGCVGKQQIELAEVSCQESAPAAA